MKNKVRTFIEKARLIFINRSLMKKSIGAYITVIVIPIVIFSVYTFKSLDYNAKKDAIDKHTYELNIEYDAMEKSSYIMRNMFNTIVPNNELFEYVDNVKGESVKELINFNDTI